MSESKVDKYRNQVTNKYSKFKEYIKEKDSKKIAIAIILILVIIGISSYMLVFYGDDSDLGVGQTGDTLENVPLDVDIVSQDIDIENNEYTLEENKTIELSAEHPEVNRPLSYNWTIDEDSNENTDYLHIDQKSITPELTTDKEEYTIRLQVDDPEADEQYTEEVNILTVDETDIISRISSNNNNVEKGTDIKFNGSDSSAINSNITSYEWDFDDGNTDSGENIEHSFEDEGMYNISLTVENDNGDTDTSYKTIEIIDDSEELNAQIETNTSTAYTFEDIEFDSSNSRGDNIKEYTWALEFGEVKEGEIITHSYSDHGNYTVELTIENEDGDTDVDTKEIEIKANTDVRANIDTNKSGYSDEKYINEDIEFYGDDSTASHSEIISYDWDFDDGNRGSGETTTYQYEESGEYTVSLTVENDEGDTDTTTRDITVQEAKLGSERNPYRIEDEQDLQDVTQENNCRYNHYILTNDIDASSTESWNDGDGFEPITSSESYDGWCGVIDGQGYEISNLHIDREFEQNVGLISNFDGGLIENIELNNVQIIGSDKTGALIGRAEGGAVENVYIEGSIEGNDNVGGLVGDNMDRGIDIHYTSFDGDVTGGARVGGVIGSISDSDSHISNSYSTSSVEGDSHIGGLAGISLGTTINTSYSTGDVTGNFRTGGFVGDNRGEVIDSYSTGDVTGEDRVGGFIGQNSGKVSESYSIGSVSGDENIGGFIGRESGDILEVTNSYWDIDASGIDSDGADSTEGLNTDEMQGESAEDNMSGFDFTSTWSITDEYPELP